MGHRFELRGSKATFATFEMDDEGDVDDSTDDGNVTVYLDGHPIGLLWLHLDSQSEQPVATLGGWFEEGEWVETHTIGKHTHGDTWPDDQENPA